MGSSKLTLALGGVAALLGGLTPAAQAAPAPYQDNIRHFATIPGATGGHVAAEGDHLYVGAFGLGFRVFDISNPADPVQIGQYYGPTSDSPGARSDAVPDATVINGREIATLNGTGRVPGGLQTEFLDFTDPAAPVLLHRFTGANEGEAHNGDMVDGRALWLPSGGRSGDMLRIYDLGPLLENPPRAPARLANGMLRTMWQTSPYRAGKPLGPNPTHVHDLEVYTDYNLLLRQSEWVDADGDGDKDPTYRKRDIAFYAASEEYALTVVPAAVSNSAVYIVDITNPRAPVVINMIQGRPGHRYMHEVQVLDGDRHVMFTADEDLHNGCNAGGIYSWRLSDDLTTATFLDSWFNGTGTPAPVCSAHVFSSRGPYVFMGAYNAGLQVIDFTDPANLTRAGQYIAPGMNSWGALYYRGYVYVGDFGARGLDVFQFLAAPAGQAYVAPDPAQTLMSGVNERLCENGQSSPPTVDALMVQIPASKRDGSHTFRAVGTGPQPYDLNVYFRDANCAYMPGTSLAGGGRDEMGAIPKNAHYAFISNVGLGPTYSYGQIDPFL